MAVMDLSKAAPDSVAAILSRKGGGFSRAVAGARRTVEGVRRGGDAALRSYAVEFEGFVGGSLRVTDDEIQIASERTPAKVMSALRTAKRRIEGFHRRQRLEEFEFRDRMGRYGQRVVPLDRVGVYVPGGTAAYPSSALMACVPARIAGVREVVIFTPGRGGKVGDATLAAAGMCGVEEVYAVGGAQSVAAMAYGTETIRKVQKIVGPGGAYVTAAKQLVRNECEIDSIAGPSEVLIVADRTADPWLVACDMLAQLEHDTLAKAVLVTDSMDVAASAERDLAALVSSADRRDVASSAAERGASFVLVRDMDEAIGFSNRYAPEHLLIDTADPWSLLGGVRNAGSVFLGRHSSVAFGDYCSGTNHILPTNGTAAASSALSVYDFIKVMPYQEMSGAGAYALSRVVATLASAEGLPGHAQAALARAGRVNK